MVSFLLLDTFQMNINKINILNNNTCIGPDAFFYVGLEGSPTSPNPHAADTAWRLYPLGTAEEAKLGRYENQEVRLHLPQGVKVDICICGLRE